MNVLGITCIIFLINLICTKGQYRFDPAYTGPPLYKAKNPAESDPNIPRNALRERMIMFNHLKRPGIEIYAGIGHASPFEFVQSLNSLPCDEAKHKALKIQEWWNDYFTNATIDKEKYADLLELVKKESMTFDLYKTALANVCFMGYRLLNCAKECKCRTPQTASQKVSAYSKTGKDTTHEDCLIVAGQPCARRTKPGDYDLYKKTRRLCQPGLCCKYNPLDGSSACNKCTGGSNGNLKLPTFSTFLVEIVVWQWIQIFLK